MGRIGKKSRVRRRFRRVWVRQARDGRVVGDAATNEGGLVCGGAAPERRRGKKNADCGRGAELRPYGRKLRRKARFEAKGLPPEKG